MSVTWGSMKPKLTLEEIQRRSFCPQCGGVFFAGSNLNYEHRDSLCPMRWINHQWIPVESIDKKTEQQ